jgi:hypothetical protein
MVNTSWSSLAQQADERWRECGDYSQAEAEVIAAHADGRRIARGRPFGDGTGRQEVIPAWWWSQPIVRGAAPAEIIVVEKTGLATIGLLGVTTVDCRNCLTWRETKVGRIGYQAVESREAREEEPPDAAVFPKAPAEQSQPERSPDVVKWMIDWAEGSKHERDEYIRAAKAVGVSRDEARKAYTRLPPELKYKPGERTPK